MNLTNSIEKKDALVGSLGEPSINTQVDLKCQPLKYLKWRISALHKKEMTDLANIGTNEGHKTKPI